MRKPFFAVITIMTFSCACRKHDTVTYLPPATPTQPQNTGGDSSTHNDTTTPDSSITYSGFTNAEGDCGTIIHVHQPQDIIVTMNVHDNRIHFPAFGQMAKSQDFTINSRHQYTLVAGKDTYQYHIKGDSLILSYDFTGGQCTNHATFRGKLK